MQVGGRMKGGLIRVETTRSKIISCKGQQYRVSSYVARASSCAGGGREDFCLVFVYAYPYPGPSWPRGGWWLVLVRRSVFIGLAHELVSGQPLIHSVGRPFVTLTRDTERAGVRGFGEGTRWVCVTFGLGLTLIVITRPSVGRGGGGNFGVWRRG